MKKNKHATEIIEYQPDAVEIEERPVQVKIRWVLYIIVLALIAAVVGAIFFKGDRFVRSRVIDHQFPSHCGGSTLSRRYPIHQSSSGDTVEKDQILARFDPISPVRIQPVGKQKWCWCTTPRIRAELEKKPFTATPEEGEDGAYKSKHFLAKDDLGKNRRTLKTSGGFRLPDLKAVERRGL